MKLRPYQTETLQAIRKMQEKTNKQVVVWATGLGKTVLAAHLLKERNGMNGSCGGKKAMFLAHREELLEQASDKIRRVDPSLSVAIEQAERKTACEQIIVASVPTLGRNNSTRIEKFRPEDFSTIIIDEAHHASASSYKNILRHFGVLKGGSADWNKEILLLGITATPNRMDNEGIDQIFDETVYSYGILEGIQNGWLSRIRAFRVDTKTDLNYVHTQAGDFAVNELAAEVNNRARNQLIVKTYQDLLNGKQALVFAVNIYHAVSLSNQFREAGIKVVHIIGSTTSVQRRLYLERFYKKEIQVMVNCMVLTEGYDNDTIDAILMARPTQSGILYQQMIGRGTRTHTNKPFLTVVDFVDNTTKHLLKTSASLLGLEGAINFQGKDILESKEEIDKIRELNPNFDLNRVDMDKIKYIMEEIDLLAGLGVPEEIREDANFSWHRFGVDAYRIGIGDNRYFTVFRTLTGQYKVTYEIYNTATKQTYTEELGECETLKEGIQRTETYIFNKHKDSLKLISRKAAWRVEPPTPKQLAFLMQFKGKYSITPDLVKNIDKGQASDLMTKIINLNMKYE